MQLTSAHTKFLAFICMAFSLLIVSCTLALADGPQVLIDTKFDSTNATGGLGTSPEPSTIADLPLKTPTQVSAHSPSTIVGGKDSMGEVSPPYALLTAAASVENPDVVASTEILWRLNKLHLTSGQYEITYKVTQLVEETKRGDCLRIYLVKEDGNSPGGPGTHPVSQFLGLMFQNGQLQTNTSGLRGIAVGDTQHIRITLDLDNQLWSVYANDTPIAEKLPFTSTLKGGGLHIGYINFGSDGGLGDHSGGACALSDLKMVRLK